MSNGCHVVRTLPIFIESCNSSLVSVLLSIETVSTSSDLSTMDGTTSATRTSLKIVAETIPMRLRLSSNASFTRTKHPLTNLGKKLNSPFYGRLHKPFSLLSYKYLGAYRHLLVDLREAACYVIHDGRNNLSGQIRNASFRRPPPPSGQSQAFLRSICGTLGHQYILS